MIDLKATALCVWGMLALHPDSRGVALWVGDRTGFECFWREMVLEYERSELLRKLFLFQRLRIVNKAFPETWFFSARWLHGGATALEQANAIAGLFGEDIVVVLGGGACVEAWQVACSSLARGVNGLVLDLTDKPTPEPMPLGSNPGRSASHPVTTRLQLTVARG